MFPKKDDSAESRALHEHDHEHHHDHDHSDVEDQGNISFQLFHLVKKIVTFACRVTPFGEKKKFRVKDVGRMPWDVVKIKDVFIIRNYWITYKH